MTRFLQLLVLLLVTGLLAGSECYALCLGTVSESTGSVSAPCHHHAPAKNLPCSHRVSHETSSEPGLYAATPTPSWQHFVTSADLSLAFSPTGQLHSISRRESPPATRSLVVSILRV